VKRNFLIITWVLFILTLSGCYVFLGPAGVDGEQEADRIPPNTPTVSVPGAFVNVPGDVRYSISGGEDNEDGSGFSHYEYDLFGGGNSDQNTLTALTGTIVPSFGVANGQSYYLFIRSVDKAGNASAYTRADIGLDTDAPSSPGSLTINVNSDGRNATLSWSAVADPFSGTRFYLLTLDDGTSSCDYNVYANASGVIYSSNPTLQGASCPFLSLLTFNANVTANILNLRVNTDLTLGVSLTTADRAANSSSASSASDSFTEP